MPQIVGKLVPESHNMAGDAYAGHSVQAMIPVAFKLGDGSKATRARYAQTDTLPSGRFEFDLPPDEEISGTSEFIVRSPAGTRLAIVAKEHVDSLEIKVDPAKPVDLARADIAVAPARAMLPVHVALHDRTDPARTAGRLVLIWGRPKEQGGGEPESVLTLLAADHADASGRARLEIPAVAYAHLEIEALGNRADPSRIPVALDADGKPAESVEMLVDMPEPEATAAADCACETAVAPPAPDHADLLASDKVYAQDLNGGGCVQLTVPNRTLEEYSFYSLVRTTDPVLWGLKPKRESQPPLSKAALGMAAEIAFGISALDAELDKPNGADIRPRSLAADGQTADDLRLSSEAYRSSGLITARAWRGVANLDTVRKTILEKATALSEQSLRQALSDPDGFTPVSLMTAERKSAVEDIETLVAKITSPAAGRQPASTNNTVQWDAVPKTVQAATIAHGHLLEFRQQWKAAGYSLGDLLYSLPLAPGQKRRMVILDWDRQETGIRQESRTFREDFGATLSRDRDVAEIVNSTITESIRGGSSANTWGAGGGIGLGIPVGSGFLGLGVAGGGGGASSTAWQNSARNLAASTAQQLADRTQQASSAVRSQRGTVVTSQHQGESVSVTSEIVANYNHCHALTIQYFEMLKHYRVDQELASVKECLFVPLLMTRFDDLKALRWQDVLQDRLRDRSLRPGFEAMHRIQTGYADADVPLARYADEPVVEIWGELRFEMQFARPRLPSEGEDLSAYLNSSWNFWDQLFGIGSAEQAYRTHIAGQSLSDRIFADELAPRLAVAFCDRLQLWMTLNNGTQFPITADFTLVSPYRGGREHLVTFRVAALPSVRRSDVRGLTLRNDLEFAANSRVVLRFASVSYRNSFQSFQLVPPRRANDDVRAGDMAFLSARALTKDEEFNPRKYDLQLRDNLLKHLNEHIENYHHLIWWLMDAGRRFMLLDGFVAPNSGGRSVASVTENRLINIIGNCIVLPVAPGYSIDPTVRRGGATGKPIDLLGIYQPTIPIPPRRISVPTRGVYAEAIMGACNSCQKIEDDRFWRWEEEPIPDDPTQIGSTSTDTRRQQPPDTKLTDFPAPVVAIQNAPEAPTPTSFATIAGLLGQQNLFKDISGLAENQANALNAFKQAMQTANNFGKLAAAGAKAVHAQRNSERVMKKVGEARAKKLLNDEDAKQVTGKLFGALNADVGGGKKPLATEAPVKEAVEKVLQGNGKKTLNVSSTTGNTSQEAKVEIADGAAATTKPAVHQLVSGIVPHVLQDTKSKGCWAAALTMLKSWAANQSMTIETALAEGGQAYIDKFNNNTGLAPNEVPAFMQAYKLRDASIGALTATGLAKQLAERGPLWVVADEDSSVSFSVHARVVTGITGDGTPQGTKVLFHDPAASTPDEESLQTFISKLEQLAAGISSTFGGLAPQLLSI